MANVYNAFDFGLDPTNTAPNNNSALQSAVNAAVGNKGGTILIPSFSPYSISGAVSISISDGSAISIVGSSGSAQFIKADGTDLFQVTNNGGGDGVLFQDIHVTYSGTFSNVAAFRFSMCQNGRLFRAILEDCPLGVVFVDCSQCSIAESRAVYTAQNGATLITVETGGQGGTQQTRIYACDFDVSSSATGCTGVSVTQSTDLTIDDSRFLGFANAITLAAASGESVVRSIFRGVSCETTGTAVTIVPASSSSGTTDLRWQNGSS